MTETDDLPWDKIGYEKHEIGPAYYGAGHWIEVGPNRENGRFVPEDKIQELWKENANLKRRVEVLRNYMCQIKTDEWYAPAHAKDALKEADAIAKELDNG